MSGPDKQMKNPRPQGTSGNAVPVLFSLRNVQPSIVVNSTSSKRMATSEPSVAMSPPAAVVVPPAPVAPTVSAPSAVSTPSPAARSNRSYNIVVGLLVIAICLIVIKNASKNNTSQKGAIATKTDSSPEVDSKSAASKVTTNEATSPIKSNGSGAFELNPPPLSIPTLPKTNSSLTQAEPKLDKPTIDFPADPMSLKELSAYEQRSSETLSLAQPQAPLPVLLSSAKPEASVPQIPNLPKIDPARNNTQTVLNFPDARTAMKSDVRVAELPTATPSSSHTMIPSLAPEYNSNANLQKQDAGTSYQPIGSNTSNPVAPTPSSSTQSTAYQPTAYQPTAYQPYTPQIASPPSAINQPSTNQPATNQPTSSAILNTSSPHVTTQELMEIKMRGSNSIASNPLSVTQTQPSYVGQNVPAIPVSNVEPRFESAPSNTAILNPNNFIKDNGMLAGTAYPPLPKEYQPIAVRPYEQGALSNLALPPSTPYNQTIRQPDNRYPKQPTATAPYTPMTGNSTIGR